MLSFEVHHFYKKKNYTWVHIICLVTKVFGAICHYNNYTSKYTEYKICFFFYIYLKKNVLIIFCNQVCLHVKFQ